MSEMRARDAMLAVHELAANAVRHGAGRGRLRMWSQEGALCCQVRDGGQKPRTARRVLATGQTQSRTRLRGGPTRTVTVCG
jgi:anti-sigma regulatory factor (Ser/Thr protein kinase)